MSNSNRTRIITYQDEREGKIKDANKKLKAQIKSLKKALKNSESDKKQLSRAFNKNSDIIKNKLEEYSIEEVLEMIRDYEYKETEKGRQKERKRKKESEDNEVFISQNCPECGKKSGEGFLISVFEKFTINSCSCGYRLKVDTNEGIKRS